MEINNVSQIVQTVLPEYINNNTVILNPNDALGIELKLFEYDINLFCDYEEFSKGMGESEKIKLLIENNCPAGTIKMSYRRWRKLNKPNTITLIRNNENYFLKSN